MRDDAIEVCRAVPQQQRAGGDIRVLGIAEVGIKHVSVRSLQSLQELRR
jgi:hypothetical protein